MRLSLLPLKHLHQCHFKYVGTKITIRNLNCGKGKSGYSWSFSCLLYLIHKIIHVCAKSLQSCPTFCDPMDCSPREAPLSIGFSRQEYWSGLPFPSPGDLPDPGIESTACEAPALHAGSLPLSHQGSQRVVFFGVPIIMTFCYIWYSIKLTIMYF